MKQSALSLVAKYAEKRAALKAIISELNASEEERWDAVLKLQSLPRDSLVSVNAIVVRILVVHTVSYVNSVLAALSFVKLLCVVKSLALKKPAGNRSSNMSMQDPIADMFTRIRNGQTAAKVAVSMPSSKLKVCYC